jgi:hypothetical protein
MKSLIDYIIEEDRPSYGEIWASESFSWIITKSTKGEIWGAVLPNGKPVKLTYTILTRYVRQATAGELDYAIHP